MLLLGVYLASFQLRYNFAENIQNMDNYLGIIRNMDARQGHLPMSIP